MLVGRRTRCLDEGRRGQLVYNPLWSAPSTALAYAWKESDFSWRATVPTHRRGRVHGGTLVVDAVAVVPSAV